MKEEEEDVSTENLRPGYGQFLARRLWQQNRFTLIGDVDARSMDELMMFLITRLDEGAKKLELYISSHGGEEDHARGAMALIQTVKAAGVRVSTIGLGWVGSAALDLFMVGSKGFRLVHEFTLLMTHVSETSVRGKQEARLRLELDDRLYSRFTRIRKDRRDALAEEGKDWFFTAEEAIQLGIADRLISGIGIEGRIPTDMMGGVADG